MWNTLVPKTSPFLGIRKGAAIIASLLLTIAPMVAPNASAAPAQAIPTGTWNVNANGATGLLAISTVDTHGNVCGSIFGDPIRGFWDGVNKKLSFARYASCTTLPGVATSALQTYTAYLYQAGSSYVLDGTFEALESDTRTVFAWTAQIVPTTTPGGVQLDAPSIVFPLPNNNSWSVDVNGVQGSLVATADSTGVVSGTLFGNTITGRWDGVEQRLTFIRVIDPNHAGTWQVYTGFFFADPPCQFNGFSRLHFSGYVEAFESGGTPQRNVFGWDATGQTPFSPCL